MTSIVRYFMATTLALVITMMYTAVEGGIAVKGKTKTCTRCGVARCLDEFSVASRYKDHRQSWCKVCYAAYARRRNRRLARRKYIPVPATQKCSNCGIVKPSSMFSPDRTNLHGIGAWCKPCRRLRLRAQKHNLSEDELTALLRSHKGHCPICGRAFNKVRRQEPVIDHCHETGVIRGLLCSACNQVLGLMQDDPSWLTAAARYLRKARK